MSEPVRLVPQDQNALEGYSVADVAKHLGVTPRAVRRYIERGQLDAERTVTPRGIEWRIVSLDLRRPSVESARKIEPVHAESEDGRGPDRTAGDDLGPTVESPPAESPALLKVLDLLEQERRRNVELERERGELFGRLGYFQAQLEEARERIKLLEAPTPKSEASSSSQRRWWRLWRR
jgi:hypothetical protein